MNPPLSQINVPAGTQNRLDRLKTSKSEAPERHVLGKVQDVENALPMEFEFGGNPFRLVRWDNRLVAHSTVCPHYLGPLEHCSVADGGIVICPWHGCEFDIVSGRSSDGNSFRMREAPTIEVDGSTGEIVAIRPV